MGQIFEAVVDYLTEDDWKFQVVKEDMALVLSFRGRSGSWQCLANVDEERQWFSFFSILPSNVPEKMRPVIAEFLTRANYGLVIGNFEMDFNDGEIRYKTSVDVEGGELTPKMIENIMKANLMTLDRYFPGLMGVIYGNKAPAEAISDIEGGGSDHDEHEEDEDLEEFPLDGDEDDENEEDDINYQDPLDGPEDDKNGERP